MRVRWTKNATEDLVAIQDHIGRDSSQYAIAVVDRILHRVTQLETFPESGSVVAEYLREVIREIFVYSYRVVHQIHENEVRILTVCHGANPLVQKGLEIR